MENKQIYEPVMDCVLFKGVQPQQIETLLEYFSKKETFCKGEIIYSPQSFQKSLGIISRGIAIVEKENGVILNRLTAGECFGAAALFLQQERYVTIVRAKTDCEILFLSAEAMQDIIEQSPKIALNYIHFLSGRIQFLNHRIDSFTASSAEDSLLAYLQQQPNQCSDGVPMSKLAEILNLGRTSLYRAADHLETCGKIKKEGKRIELIE